MSRALVWFRRDLRVSDHPALTRAAEAHRDGLIAAYAVTPAMWRAHDDAPVKVDLWLRSVRALSAALAARNVPLVVLTAHHDDDLAARLVDLAERARCAALYHHREHEVNERRRDETVRIAFARMESPRAATLPRSAVALAPVFATVAERHRDEGRATPRLRVLSPPSDLAVLGDPGLVEGLVDNLAVAALRHARRGFDARIEARAGVGVAEISLEDEGTRYSDDGAEFSRGAQPRLQHGGHGRYAPGAGLYVIGLVARAFGGDVSVRRLGERDRLVVTLPLAR